MTAVMKRRPEPMSVAKEVHIAMGGMDSLDQTKIEGQYYDSFPKIGIFVGF
jgi:hypothetical protein